MQSKQLAVFTFLVTSALFSSSTLAQHARIVLFGEPNPRASEIPEEQRFVHPITAPYFHEDSFVTTDARVWFIHHDFPGSTLSGEGQVTALQIRVALLDNLQFVAYKDGYIDLDTAVIDTGGLADVGAGVKWNFLQDWDNQFHAAVGVGYEIRAGDGRVLQNDDEWRFWASANKGYGALHIGATINLFLAEEDISPLGDSDHLSWHLHADYYTCSWFSPVLELNGYHILDEGTVALPFQGIDVANLGGDKGEDVVTIGVGGEFRLADNIDARVAYEVPLTSNTDLFDYRWTFSIVFSD